MAEVNAARLQRLLDTLDDWQTLTTAHVTDLRQLVSDYECNERLIGSGTLGDDWRRVQENRRPLVERARDIHRRLDEDVPELAAYLEAHSLPCDRLMSFYRERRMGLLAAVRTDLDRAKVRASLQAPPPPDPRPVYQFRRVAKGWRLRFDSEEGDYENDLGFERVEYLLRRPGQAVPALVLVGGAEQLGSITHTCQEAMDHAGRGDSERRCRQLAADIEGARARGDSALEAELRSEFEQVTRQLRADTGRGGRPRRIDRGSPAEKAKNTAGKSFARLRKRLKDDMPRLADHLKAAIQSEGTTYVYRTSPTIPWEFC
jgi:hypothetical protein